MIYTFHSQQEVEVAVDEGTLCALAEEAAAAAVAIGFADMDNLGGRLYHFLHTE